MALQTDNEIIEGKFKAELKNRFLCTVCVDGEDITCYIPSSCKLSNFIDLKNRTVLLKKNASPKAKTVYSVYAVKYGRRYILLNLSQVNSVIEDQLSRRYFSFLGKRKRVLHEANVGGYKTDLYIQDTNTLIEIKSLLSLEKAASFPAVYSERAVEQLKKLSHLLDEGYKVCYMLVSLTFGVEEIRINTEFEEFCDLFKECVQKGMMVSAVSLRMVGDKVEVHSKVKLSIK